MKNRPQNLAAALALVGLVSLTAWTLASAWQTGGQASQADRPRSKTLRDIARERDIEVEESAEGLSAEYDDLRLLAKHAEAIIVGRITDEESSFDGDNHIVTSYRLDVQRVIKETRLNAPLNVGQEPPVPLVTPLKLVRPGGTVEVEGRRASRVLKGSERLKPGHDFLLFLWWSPNFKAYRLAGGVSGAFLIDGEQRLRPLGSRPGMLRHKGDGLEAVLDEIRAGR